MANEGTREGRYAPSRGRGVTPSLLSRAYALLAPLILVLEIVGFVLREQLVGGALAAKDPALALALFGGTSAVLALVALLVLLRERRRPLGSLGRGRLLTSSVGGLVHGTGNFALLAVVGRADVARIVASGYALEADVLNTALAALLVSGFGALLLLGSALSAFSLLSDRARAIFFWVLDAALLAGVAYVVTQLPSRPPDGNPDLLLKPIIRHVVTTFALMRLMVRALPFALDAIERIGLMPLVASRHLRSKKSGFLAAISMLSVMAVMVSCIALTVTLSVMGGFRNDLKRKILSNNAHISIDKARGAITDWRDVLGQTQRIEHVTGASPFVSGEVMLSSATNLATGVLRGIDPKLIGKVNDLPDNLQAGKLEYLTSPEKLLDLPTSVLQTSLLAPLQKPDAGVAEADAGAGEADAGAGTELKAEADRLQKKIDEIEAFLREPARARPKDRDVLPGIIVGKELARALRLYVGDEVNVVAPLGTLGPTGPMPKARPFRVAGIFYSGMPEYDMKFTYVTLETGQKFLNLGESISGIDVRVTDIERAPAVATAIRGMIRRPEIRVRDWQELNKRLFGALALEKLAMFITLGIAIVVASFCIAGTLTLMVQEKGREVAILKAMGTSDRTVVGVFVIEGGLIGLLGASLGLFLGFMLCFAAEHFGVRMDPDVYYMDRLPVHMDLTEFAMTGVAAVLLCLAITIYPALLASRLRPVDALRYE
jgi:lipoprotein-releasing system permease protein